jgi:hypothetical protein
MADIKAEIFSPSRQRKADRYLWYWKPPFGHSKSDYYFDREHWWKGSLKNVSHDAALYELLRRHPTVGEFKCQTIHSMQGRTTTHQAERKVILKGATPLVVTLGPDPVYHVASEIFGFCLRPWNKLSREQQAKFQNCLKVTYPGKGQDLTRGVFDVTDAAQKWAESEKDAAGPSFDECLRDLAAGSASDGRLILAIDTDFSSREEADAALKQLTGIFWEHWRKPPKLVRARDSAWLKAIQDFESDFDLEKLSLFKLG